MSEEQDEKERGFKIDDRAVSPRKGKRVGSRALPELTVPANPGPRTRRAIRPTILPFDAEFEDEEETFREGAPEDLTFSSFVIGLASQAFAFLGAVPDPQSGVVRKDLPQAKALIDILSMLKEKTTGNLDEHEARMMEEMLYELRIHYVKELRGVASQGGKS
jgi:hypothetical protein